MRAAAIRWSSRHGAGFYRVCPCLGTLSVARRGTVRPLVITPKPDDSTAECGPAHPLVSICVPTYNGARFLEAALESALAQTYAPFEILLSDDGSTDETPAILERYRAAHPDIVRVLAHPRLGMVPNWNHLAAEARGVYVKYLFQDDLLLPTCVARLVAATGGDPDVGLVFSRRSILTEADGGPTMFTSEDTANATNLPRGWTRLAAMQDGIELLSDPRLLHGPINKVGEPTTVLLRKDLFERIGGFDARLLQVVDVEMWLRVFCHAKVAFVDEELSVFRMHARQATWKNTADGVIPGDTQLMLRILASDPRFGPLRRVRAHAPRSTDAAATPVAATPDPARVAIDGQGLSSLRKMRREALQLWLRPYDAATREGIWSAGAGELFRRLYASGIQDHPLDDDDVRIVVDLERAVANVAGADRSILLLALFLYLRPSAVATPHDASPAPAWLSQALTEASAMAPP